MFFIPSRCKKVLVLFPESRPLDYEVDGFINLKIHILIIVRIENMRRKMNEVYDSNDISINDNKNEVTNPLHQGIIIILFFLQHITKYMFLLRLRS
jgi:hypothetical protein